MPYIPGLCETIRHIVNKYNIIINAFKTDFDNY